MDHSYRRKIIPRLALGVILTLFTLMSGIPNVEGRSLQQISECRQVAFSISEDFLTQGPVPPDGNPVISDGDLLGANCHICARNAQLLLIFQVPFDLGLDAVDILSFEDELVAFSTELNSPNVGQFSAGDLLMTNGIVIPNVALTHAFAPIGYDLGLDALHFVGQEASILEFVDLASQYARQDWLNNPGMLAGLLEEFRIDIWFSTEGTWTPAVAAGFLDGDLLSAGRGVIVAPNKDLLPPSVPAGIPDRGVDFGLDAATTDRLGNLFNLHYSTEILYSNDVNFTDGDALRYGNGVAFYNIDFTGCFEPKARMLGLDALYMSELENPTYLPLIMNTRQGGN